MAVLAMYGCQVKEIGELTSVREAKVFTAVIEDNSTVGTKTSLDNDGNVRWKQGDQVSIFAGSTINEQYQVTDASDGKTSASLYQVTSPGFVAGSDIDNNVAFYPYAATVSISKSESAYILKKITLPSIQYYAEGSFGNGAFPMTAVTSSPSDYNLKFKNVLGGLKLQLKGTATIASISVMGNSNEILCGATEVTVANGSVPSISLTDATAKTVILDCGNGVQLNTATATPFIIALPAMTMEGGFTVTVTDTEGKQMEIKTTKPQTITRSRLLKMPAVTYEGTTPVIEHQYVDLGLPSGLKWATCNVGADNPEEYGDYFAWGEIEPYYSSLDPLTWKEGKSAGYNWSSYKWCNGSENTLTKYNNNSSYGMVDNKTILDLDDDAARANWGGNWQMPNDSDWAELWNNCTREWVEYDVPGFKLTSNINGNTIFLPAAGLMANADVLGDEGSKGYYWSVDLRTSKPSTANCIHFYSTGEEFKSYSHRNFGFQVRPVTQDPNNVAVSGVEINSSNLSLVVGEAETLIATVKPDNATNKSVIWSSTNNAIAEVDQNGNITAKAAGTVTITATTSDGDYMASCEVTVTTTYVPVSSITLDKTTVTLQKDLTVNLVATVLPDNANVKTVIWTSSDSSVATVDQDGFVTAISAGTATITVTTSDGGRTATCTVTVVVPVTDISLNKTRTTLPVGATESLTATITPSNATDKSVTWFSSNTNVATVTDSGIVSAKAAGSATITVTTNDGGKCATCSVTVVQCDGEDNGHYYVDLDLPSGLRWAICNVGTDRPEGYGNYFAWGETEPKSEYKWITYKFCNGSSTTLTKYNSVIDYGSVDNKVTLELADDAARANWQGKWRMPTKEEFDELINSSNCTTETVHQNNVYGIKITSKKNGNSIFIPGAYYWSSSLYSGYQAWYFFTDCSVLGADRDRGFIVRPVTVDGLTVAVTSVSLNKTGTTMAVGVAETLVASISPFNAIDKSVTWSSSNTNVATVTDSGIVMAKAAGSATITVTTNDGGKYATCLVTVVQCDDGEENGHFYVDLGLPSGLKWATCNVGADSPEEYGNYFAWGETTSKSEYTWTNYKFRASGDSWNTLKFSKYNTYSEYGTVDNKTVLDPGDDAASVNWGGSWRMPTRAEFEELINSNNCTTDQTVQNGVYGIKITSKKYGNSIFLPGAGFWEDAALCNAGSLGYYWSAYYWSSSLITDSFAAWSLRFDSGIASSRLKGLSVRPVCE